MRSPLGSPPQHDSASTAAEPGPGPRRAGLRAVLLALAALAAGCGEPSRTQAPAAAAREPLSVGLIPENNIFRQLDRYEPLADYLAARTGQPILLRVLPRYGNIVENFEDGQMQAAFFGSFTYVLAREKLGVEVLARPERADGRSTYHGLLIVRKDSGIRDVKDMKGKIFAFVDHATTAGYLFPVAFLRRHGVADPGKYLRETYFAGTHEDAIIDVLDHRADVAAVKNTVFEDLETREPRMKRELAVLADSEEVPENSFAVRSDLDPALKAALKAALLGAANDAEGRRALATMGARRFIPTDPSAYEPVYRYAREVGIDLRTYAYRNE